MKAAFGDF